MKKIRACWWLALVLVWCAVGALAEENRETGDTSLPRLGVAVAAPQDAASGGEVPMYEKMDETSTVLMSFYSGARLEVVAVRGDMVQVQCGETGASVMGYMRAQDLRYGVRAMREVPQCYMLLDVSRPADVYAYCDAQSAVIDAAQAGAQVQALGRNAQGWVQIRRECIEQSGGWEHGAPQCGFMKLSDGLGNGVFSVQEHQWFVLPAEDEMTYEEARKRAIALALTSEEAMSRLPQQRRSAEALETVFWSDVRLIYSAQSGAVCWEVYFQAEDDYTQSFSVFMEADGTIREISHGNG